MSTNRLLPQQFSPGNTLDFTRVEQALLALTADFNDVPANLMQRRWSPSTKVWGLSPNQTITPTSLPWMGQVNGKVAVGPVVAIPPGTFDVQSVNFGVAPVAGNTARLTISGVNYDFLVPAGFTNEIIADGLVAASANNPLYNVTVNQIASIFVGVKCTKKISGFSAVVITAVYTAGPGTFSVVNTVVGTSLFQNPQRTKSNTVSGIVLPPITLGGQDLLTWEVSFASSRPVIVANLSVLARADAGVFFNQWKYGAVPPTGKVMGDPTTDFTLQCAVNDGWDLDNRRKLRQESLVYNMRSDAFKYSPVGIGGVVDTMVPHDTGAGAFDGFAVRSNCLILVPAFGRVRFQWTIPRYPVVANSTWGAFPSQGNVWTLSATILEATR